MFLLLVSNIEVTDLDSSTGEYALIKVSASCFRWQIISSVFSRLCLIGFNYAQPFLIAQAIAYVGRPTDALNRNYGYGLIGATALIYVGIAVSILNHFK